MMTKMPSVQCGDRGSTVFPVPRITVEPLNNGHIGTEHFVQHKEVGGKNCSIVIIMLGHQKKCL